MRERNKQASSHCALRNVVQNVLPKVLPEKVSKNYSLSYLSAVVVAFVLPSMALAQGEIRESASHRFEEVADGVWLATGSGSVYTMSNALVLVGSEDTLLVDSHVTAAASRALIESLSVLTDKPVRYLVNSHYHFDHAHGNQSFPPGVEIIGHEYTRMKLNGEAGNVLEEVTFKSFSDPVPGTVRSLERQAADASSGERREQLLQQAKVQRDYMEAIKEIVPTPPNITLESKMTLFQTLEGGSREIQLRHFGRAHTGGDVLVWLPDEKIVFTGDMMLPGVAYMGDGHVDEWPATLDGLKELDFEIWLPGHGPVMRTRKPIHDFQAYLRDLWVKASDMYAAGIDAATAAETLDMTNHSENFAQIRAPGVDPRAINRIYSLLEARAN
jgi:cyclase